MRQVSTSGTNGDPAYTPRTVPALSCHSHRARYANCMLAQPVNVNAKELGNLHVTNEQKDAMVALLKTLSDGLVLPGQ